MTDADRPRFAKILAMLSEVYSEDVSEMRAEAYFRALGDLPIDAIEHGAERAVRRATFFPKPAELRDWARGRDPRLMDAMRRRGWDPEHPRFLAQYDGQGPTSPASREPLPECLPAPEERRLLGDD